LGDTEAVTQADQATLDQFNDIKNEFLLYICVEDYVRLRGAMPMPMKFFKHGSARSTLSCLLLHSSRKLP